MKRFKNIIVFIDNEDADNLVNNFMIKKAMRIARLSHAKITVLGIVKEIAKSIDFKFAKNLSIDIHTFEFEKRKLFLDQLVAPFTHKKDVVIEPKVLTGVPFLTLIRNVLKEDYPLIMVAGNPVKSLKDRLFGSTTKHLLRKCPCPVWVFKPSKRTKFNRILVAVDTSTELESERQLNKKLLEMATSLTELEHANLYILHCWELYGESLLTGISSDLTTEEVNDYLLDVENKANKRLNDFLLPFQTNFKGKNKYCIKGDPGRIVPQFIKDKKIDLLVMGTIARTGIQGFLIGNTAERILDKVKCSALAVKPDGFRTPVVIE